MTDCSSRIEHINTITYSYNRILLGNEKGRTETNHHVSELHKNTERHEDCILYEAFYRNFQRIKMIYSGGSQPAVILSLRGHLTLYGVIFSCHNWTGSATGIQWVKARMLLTFYNAQDDRHHIVIGPRCPQC